MDEIIRIDYIGQYNDRCHVETLNPLVSVVDWSLCPPIHHGRQLFGFYAVFLKQVKCGDLIYGRNYYDYQEGTLVCIAPGQVVGVRDNGETFQPKGLALLFHPDLLRGTTLGRTIKNYSFFSYESNEALHISEQEKQIVIDCFENIKQELRHTIDKHSRTLIVSYIELLLNYCTRFYDRQFITRENVNKDLLSRFEIFLNDYFASDKPKKLGLPSVRYFAEALNLSPNYFGDLVKKETGISAMDFIQSKLIDIAKERILQPGKTISEVSYELGFQYPQHFSRMFKKRTGLSPNEYKIVI